MRKKPVISYLGAITLSLSLVSSFPLMATTSQETYRLYNPSSGEHFYTQSLNEKNTLYHLGWWYEGIAWNTPVQGKPVYRLYNLNSGEHHYTLDANERDTLMLQGWKYENVAFYSDLEGNIPVYRLYDSKALKAGSHHYTAEWSEMQNLKQRGWKDEGIGWYVSQGARLLAKPDIKGSQPTTPSNVSILRLNVPQSIQETSWWAGPACLQMILSYYGLSVSQSQLAAELGTTSNEGTKLENFAYIANQYLYHGSPQSSTAPGYRAVVLPAWSSQENERAVFEKRALDDLRNGIPVVVSINSVYAYNQPNNEANLVVIYGAEVNASGSPTTFYFLEPSYIYQDPNYQGRKTIPATTLWTCMSKNPNPGYIW